MGEMHDFTGFLTRLLAELETLSASPRVLAEYVVMHLLGNPTHLNQVCYSNQ